jgi:hypothetical protein
VRVQGREEKVQSEGLTSGQGAHAAAASARYCLGLLVDKDDLINYQLLTNYQLLIRTFTYQPTVDKTIRGINQLLTLEGLLMIVDKVWKLTNTGRVDWMLGPHTHRDNPVSRIMCAPVAPPVTVCVEATS